MKTKEKIAEFGLNQLLGIGITLVVLGIALTYGLSIMSDTKVDMCSGNGYLWNSSNQVCVSGVNHSRNLGGPAEFNASNDAITGIAKIPTKLPLIVTIVIAVIIIGILIRYLGGMGKDN